MKKIILITIFFLAPAYCVFSQNKIPETSKTEIIRISDDDYEISEIIKNLNTARINGNLQMKKYWEEKLNGITKPQIIETPQNSFIGKKESNYELSSIEGLRAKKIGDWFTNSVAISYDRIKGDIYAAVGQILSVNPLPEADTLRILRSTNNGLSFELIYSFTMPGNFHYAPNSLDMEVISKGDSSFAFIGISYSLGGNYSSGILRVRQDGNLASFAIIQGNAVNKFYNTRITSDNAKYTSGTYIYVSATLDSTIAGNRRVKSKLYRISEPYAPSLKLYSCYQDNSAGQYGYYIGSIAPANAEFESDIACVNTPGDSDLVYTVTVVRGVPGVFNDGTSLYFTKNKSLAATAPSLFVQSEIGSYLKKSPRIASTGYMNSSLVVLTRRLYQDGDWDPYSFYCRDINAPTPNFTGTFVSTATDTTVAVAITAKYRSNGTYLMGYCNRTFQGYSGDVFIRPFNSGNFGENIQINNITAAGQVGPDVCFRNVNNDSCMAVWAGYDGFRDYVTGGCSGAFIGINNQSAVIDNFVLEQNYPNPFNPSTYIKFNLFKSGYVTLKVYDVLGNEVQNLLSENKPAGSYSVKFDGSSLASGVYYYKMESGKYSDTKRMILVK